MENGTMFSIRYRTDLYDKGKVVGWLVTEEIFIDGENSQGEIVAEFPISGRFTHPMQKTRAMDYAKYLNMLVEAEKDAYDNLHLADALKR